ncbi:MAG: RluA family pseudouridine synthase [Candidatus Saccharimonadales bacterium]
MKRLVVEAVDQGKRLDVFVAQKMTDVSRVFIQKLCDDSKIQVNGAAAKDKQKLKIGDSITIDFDPEQMSQVPEVDIPIIYEDVNCLVINKPAGLLTHSKGVYNPEPTVATFLTSRITGMTGNRAGIVHRLDRATSGIMICAKTANAMAWLQKQFSQRKVKKTYVAIIEGQLEPNAAIIDMPIERHPAKPKIFRVGNNGKPALTEYKTVASGNGLSQLELKPTTGRTHQLRVHLNQLGHPIVGDKLYGGKEADRLYLHALSLELTLPGGERKIFNTDLPKEFRTILK